MPYIHAFSTNGTLPPVSYALRTPRWRSFERTLYQHEHCARAVVLRPDDGRRATAECDSGAPFLRPC